MRAGGEICGKRGYPCKSPFEYPVCEGTDDFFVNPSRLLIGRDPKTQDPLPIVVDPEMLKMFGDKINIPMLLASGLMREPSMDNRTDEIGNVVKDTDLEWWRSKEGICRSPQRPYAWFAYDKHVSLAERITLYNPIDERNPADVQLFQGSGIELSVQEMMGLASSKELNLTPADVKCRKSPVQTGETTDGKPVYSAGEYVFKATDFMRLRNEQGNGIIDILEKKDAKINGLSDARRKKVLAYLQNLYNMATTQTRFIDTQSSVSYFNIFLSLGIFVSITLSTIPNVKELYRWLRGRVVSTDFGEVIARKLKENPSYDIKGRDVESKTAWEMASRRDGYISIIFDAATGEGKDVIVEKMILMKQKGDPTVPERFRKARVMKINAAEFQAGTMYRGNVADKVAEIAREARKGPVIYYISEIDLIFLSGGTTSGDTESPGKLILDLVDDPVIKRNLLLIGTTSRGPAMLERYPDLQRRFNWPVVHQFSLSEMIDAIEGPRASELSRLYGVNNITRDMIEKSARMAEYYYRPVQYGTSGKEPPRFAGISAVLEKALQVAAKAGEPSLKFEHIVTATGELCNMSIDPALQQDVLTMSLEEVIAAAEAKMNYSDSSSQGPSAGSALPDAARQLVESIRKGQIANLVDRMKADKGLNTDPAGRFADLQPTVQEEWAARIWEALQDPATSEIYIDSSGNFSRSDALLQLSMEALRMGDSYTRAADIARTEAERMARGMRTRGGARSAEDMAREMRAEAFRRAGRR